MNSISHIAKLFSEINSAHMPPAGLLHANCPLRMQHAFLFAGRNCICMKPKSRAPVKLTTQALSRLQGLRCRAKNVAYLAPETRHLVGRVCPCSDPLCECPALSLSHKRGNHGAFSQSFSVESTADRDVCGGCAWKMLPGPPQGYLSNSIFFCRGTRKSSPCNLVSRGTVEWSGI